MARRASNMTYPPPDVRQAKPFTRLPESLRHTGEPSPWARMTRPGKSVHSFLEGPAFDRDGFLHCVDPAYGRIFRISPDGRWDVTADYDGEPGGLAIHRDGRLFVADHRHGILAIDPVDGTVHEIVTRDGDDAFLGCGDLAFADNGDLFFSDPGRSSLSDPTGRVYVLRADGVLERLVDCVPYPNGVVTTLDDGMLLVAATRANAVWQVALGGAEARPMTGLFVQLSGGLGPDGLALDAKGGLAVAHARNGCAWLFDIRGRPRLRIECATGTSVTNLAYGGPGNRTLYILEADSGTILTCEVDLPGRSLYSHA